MAQKIQVTQVSDLSGEEGAETVRFALDGTDYEIDLTPGEAEEMRAGVRPFADKARRKHVPRSKAGRKPSRSDLPEIREYARARGHEINERGRVPQRIIDEYDLMKGYSSAR